MLKKLKYSVTFPSTGREFKNDIDFETGLTAITGANEGGKSLIMEMVRYSLFGAPALRGSAADYKTLQIEFIFNVGDQDYRVVRNKKDQHLYRGEDLIATSTSMLNSKIPSILGFGIKVFDIACSCNQGDIEALGNMKPTERKRMVDTVIGLDAIEEIEKWARSESRNFQNTAAALKSSADYLQPVKPVKPKPYVEAEKGVKDLEKLQEQVRRQSEIKGLLQNVVASPGALPPKPDTDLDLVQAREMTERQQGLKVHQNTLMQRFTNIPNVTHTLEILEAEAKKHTDMDKWFKSEREFKTRGPQPTIEYPDLKQASKDLELYEKVLDKLRLLEKGHNKCPECEHTWPIADMSAFENIPDEMNKPTMDRAKITKQESYWAAWVNWERKLPARPEEPTLSQMDIAFGRQSLEKAKEKAAIQKGLQEVQAEIDTIPVKIYDVMMSLAKWDADVTAHAAADETFKKWQKDEQKLQKEMVKYEGVIEKHTTLQSIIHSSQIYDSSLEAFTVAEAKYNEACKEVNDLLEKADHYQRAGKALTNLRVRVKQHLVPSLNKVASLLLSQMTGGQRNVVEVDENFNVQIDNQALNTLSGSGKSVANLAIRLGLGQVLTGKIFSVFMGDEIDSAMDKDRAGFTSDCLRGLTQMITQVVLVTHKEIEADNVVWII